jgi:hypothetical protein
MKRYLIFVVAVCGVLFSISCGGGQPVSNTNAPKNTNAANPNSANNATASAPAKGDFYSSVYALKGNRMPDDAKLAEQKRDFRNALHINIKKPAEGINALNWNEKFKDPVNLKLEEGESVMVITFASAEGKKLEKGVYEATEATDAAETSAKDKPLAIITLIDSTGAKRLKGKVNVSDAGDIIMYGFDEKPNAPGLTAMTYGAPFKN